MNLPNFWYGTSLNLDSFRGTNHTVSCYFWHKVGLPYATEVTFSDFARKIPFGRFWPIFVKKWPFLAKNQRFG